MMMREDFDLNSVQRYTDSLKEVLKQTMINQDVMFRNQVHELHRLYRVQESLMKDFGWEECNYNSWHPKLRSSLHPFANPTRLESPAKQTRFSLTSKVGSTPFVDQELFKDGQGGRPLDLQLSAGEFINIIKEDPPKKWSAQNCFEGPVDFNPLSEGNSFNEEELELSLISRGGNRRLAGTVRTCFNNKTFYCAQNVIDLEESDERNSDGYAKCKTVLKGEHELQSSLFLDPIISTSLKKEMPHEITERSSFQEYSECCQEQTFYNEGIRVSCNDASSDVLSSKMQHFTSYQGRQLDLNKVYLDDSSCCLDLNMPNHRSRTGSEGGSDVFTGSMLDGTCPTMFHKKEVHGCSFDASDMLKQDDLVNLALVDLNRKDISNLANLAHVDLNRKDMSSEIWTGNPKICGITGSHLSLVGPKNMLSHPAGISEDLGCCSGNEKNDSVEPKSKLSSEASSEKSEVENAVLSCTDQSESSFQHRHGKAPASCKAYCVSDNDSSSAKTTESVITSVVLNQYLTTQSGSQIDEELMGEHEQRTSDISGLEVECYNKEESAEVDVLIQEAAELLIHISSEHSAFNQNSYTKVGYKDMEIERPVQPLCSYDSFELIAINLTESNVDDDSVSSKPFEINDMEAKEFGLKLRRGRRMKDFQREILPNLASLSRHEILEDINIMEGVLRSREYRKMRAKMAANGEKWSAPVRSRRSRLGYGGRRHFS